MRKTLVALTLALIAATGLAVFTDTLDVRKAAAELVGNVTIGNDGTSASPAISFLSETGLGIYRVRADVMAVSGGGLAQKEFTVAFTPGSQAANTCAPQTVTVTGLVVGDRVLLGDYPATGNALGYGAVKVSAADSVALTICNPTAGALTAAAGNFSFLVFPRPY